MDCEPNKRQESSIAQPLLILNLLLFKKSPQFTRNRQDAGPTVQVGLGRGRESNRENTAQIFSCKHEIYLRNSSSQLIQRFALQRGTEIQVV